MGNARVAADLLKFAEEVHAETLGRAREHSRAGTPPVAPPGARRKRSERRRPTPGESAALLQPSQRLRRWTAAMFVALADLCLDHRFTNPITGNPHWRRIYEDVQEAHAASPGTPKSLIFLQHPPSGPSRCNHSLTQKKWKLLIDLNRAGRLASFMGGALADRAPRIPRVFVSPRSVNA